MRCGYCDDEMTDDTLLEHIGQACVKRLQKDLAAERIENVRLREAFVTMERGYNLAVAVLHDAKDEGTHWEMNATESVPYRRIFVRLAAWEAWRRRQT